MTQSANKRLVRNISSLFLMQIANFLLPMASLPIVVRIIGPDHFGTINYAAAIVAYFVLLINYGFNLTATRSVARNPSDNDFISKLFSEVLATKVILLVIATGIFSLALLFVPDMNADSRVMWFSFLICIAWVFSPDWLYQGAQQLHKLAYFNFATKLIFTVLILLAIRQKSDYYLQPLLVTVSQGIVAFASWRYAISKFHIKLSWPGFQQIYGILQRDKTIFLSSMVISLYNTTNIIILGTISTAAEVGYYTAAQRFIGIALSLIGMPLSQSLFPYIGKAFGISQEEGLSTVRRIAPLVIWFSLISAIAMWLLGPWITGLFYGDAFYPSKQMFRIMAFSPFLISISNILGVQVMLNMHMDRPFFWITAAGATFSIVLTSGLSWWLGGLGTSYASISTEFFVVVLMAAYLSSKKITVLRMKMFNPFLIRKQMILLFQGWRK